MSTTIFTVMSALAATHKSINLGQGFPDFQPPRQLVDFLSQAAQQGFNQYAPMTGLPELREAIAGVVAERYGATVDPNHEVTVTSGATEALLNAIFAVVRPDQRDQVVMLDPSYDSYAPAVALAGATPVRVPLSLEEQGFCVDWARVGEAVNARTRLLVLNSPHNPTGAVLREGDVSALRLLLRRHPGLLVLSDEVYEHIVFDGRRHESVLRHPELARRSLVVSSFGKTYHCTGWKLGYCVAPAELSAEFRKVHQFNTFASCTPVQRAVAEMLRRCPEHHRALGGFYQEKRDWFQQQLARHTLLQPLPVEGGFFQLVDYSRVSALDDMAFCKWMTVEYGVTAIPLSPFYEAPPAQQRLARLCFAKEEKTLASAIEKMKMIPPLKEERD